MITMLIVLMLAVAIFIGTVCLRPHMAQTKRSEFVEQNLRLSQLYKGEVNPRAVVAHAQGRHFVIKIVRDKHE